MLVEHTPSYVMASSMLGGERNCILFVGYCDPSTPGGKLLANQEDSSFEFEAYNHIAEIKARIRQFDLSGHADRDQLLAYAEKLSPKTIFLTHGDPNARQWFMESLKANGAKIINPEPLTFYET
jgi:Cft2 family RNA processing exonuclease